MTRHNRSDGYRLRSRGRSDQQWDKIFHGKKGHPGAPDEKTSEPERVRHVRRSRPRTFT